MVRNVKLALVWLLAATVALAGCVVPKDLNSTEEEEKEETAETPAEPPTPPVKERRKLEMPEEPEFHPAALIEEYTGDEAITSIEATNFRGGIYVAPAESDAWVVEAGLVSLDPTCQGQSDAGDRFDILAEVVDGVLRVEVLETGSSNQGPLGEIIGFDNAWVDVKVRAPASVTGLSLSPGNHSSSQSGMPISFGKISWCGWGWGYMVHGIVAEELTVASANRNLDLAALEVTTLYAASSNALVALSDSIVGEATIESSNHEVVAKGITGSKVVATTSNGRIYLEDVDAAEVVGTTSNSAIHAVLSKESGGLWTLVSSNGGIMVEAIGEDDYGYKLEAVTSNGRIVVDLPDFEAETDEEDNVAGATEDFDLKTYRYELVLETSNDDIHVGADGSDDEEEG